MRILAFFLIPILLLSTPVYSQPGAIKYVLLSKITLPVHHIETQRIVEGHKIKSEIFNIILPNQIIKKVQQSSTLSSRFDFQAKDQILITLTALPDASTGQFEWERVELLDAITKQDILSEDSFFSDAIARVSSYKERFANNSINCFTRRQDLLPIIFRDHAYWVYRGTVLTEFFLLHDDAAGYTKGPDEVTINTAAPLVTEETYAQERKQRYAGKTRYEQAVLENSEKLFNRFL